MADKKGFLLRIDSKLLEQIQRWAGDDLRSLNGQIEYLLKVALEKSGRAQKPKNPSTRSIESKSNES